MDSKTLSYVAKTQKRLEQRPNFFKNCKVDVRYDPREKAVILDVADRDGVVNTRDVYVGMLNSTSWGEYTSYGDFADSELRCQVYSEKARRAQKFPVTNINKAKNILYVSASDERGKQFASWVSDIEDRVIAIMADKDVDLDGFPELKAAKKTAGYTQAKGEEMLRRPDAGDKKTWFQTFAKTRSGRDGEQEVVGCLKRTIIWSPKPGMDVKNSTPIPPEMREYLSKKELQSPWYKWSDEPFVRTRKSEAPSDEVLYKIQSLGKTIGPVFFVINVPRKIRYIGKPAPIFSLNIVGSVRSVQTLAGLSTVMERQELDMFEDDSDASGDEKQPETEKELIETQRLTDTDTDEEPETTARAAVSSSDVSSGDDSDTNDTRGKKRKNGTNITGKSKRKA